MLYCAGGKGRGGVRVEGKGGVGGSGKALKEASVPAKGDKMQLVLEHLQARPMPREMEPRLVCVKEPVRTRLSPQREVLKPAGKKKKEEEGVLGFFFSCQMSSR